MTTLDPQTNMSAFQKQPTVFLNNKKQALGIGKKKSLRYTRNVGLGFKTPYDVSVPVFSTS